MILKSQLHLCILFRQYKTWQSWPSLFNSKCYFIFNDCYWPLIVQLKLSLFYKILFFVPVYHTKCIDPWLTKNRRVCPICKRKVFAHDETPYNDTDSESDSDDTTPLVNPNTNHTTQGGTFEPQTENPFQRAARSISQQSQATNFVTASDHHSINGEVHSDDSSSCGSTECLIKSAGETVCENVHVHVVPGTSNPERDNESIA